MNERSLVEDLVLQLSEPSVHGRREASEKLFRLGKRASAAVPALLRATKDEDNAVRFNATAALGSTGASGPEVVQRLLEILVAPDSFDTLKGLAAVKLGQLGPAAQPLLIELLRHPDGAIRREAAAALRRGTFDRSLAVPRLIELLGDDEEEVRSSAARSLEQFGPLAEPHLENAMMTKAGHAACYAARAILRRRPDYGPAIRSLVDQLDDRDPTVRRDAAWFLEYAGPNGGPAVQRLIKALEDEDPKVRSFAAGTLGDIGLPSKGAEPALVSALKNSDPTLRQSSAYALGQLHPASPAAVDALAKAVDDQYWDVQVAAILALGKIGPQARAAVPSLRRALIRAGEDIEMRERIVDSLRLIGGPGAPV